MFKIPLKGEENFCQYLIGVPDEDNFLHKHILMSKFVGKLHVYLSMFGCVDIYIYIYTYLSKTNPQQMILMMNLHILLRM